jgi:hypothetical protein
MLVLSLTLGKMISVFFPFCMILAIYLSHIVFIMMKYVPSIFSFFQ